MFRLSLILQAFLLIFLSGCGEKIEPGTTPASRVEVRDVTISVAEIRDQPIFYEAVGTVTAGISSNLASKVLGTIQAMNVREGDLVKKGDPLIIIDQRQLTAEVEKAESALAETRKSVAASISAKDAAIAEENLALATYERFKKLREQNLISAQNFEEVEAQYFRASAVSKQAKAMIDVAEARVKSAEASVSSVSISKKDAVITAPHDGIITAKMSDKGDLATPGIPLLMLETASGFCVDVLLPETYIEYVQPMQDVSVTVPALKTGPLKGTVCTVIPSADPRSRSFTVKINLPVDMRVNSGLFARVEIPIGSSKKILITEKAIVNRGQLTGIYVVDDENISHFRLIRTGKRFGEYFEVISGLMPGDRYILNPTHELSDGAKVEVSS